jgi:hypothetical protein
VLELKMRNIQIMQKVKTLVIVAIAATLVFATSCTRKSHNGCPSNFGKIEKQEQQKDV